MNSHVFKFIATCKSRENANEIYGVRRLKQWHELIESTLHLLAWMKRDSFDKKKLYNDEWYASYIEIEEHTVREGEANNIPPENDDMMAAGSTYSKAMIEYLRKYKMLVNRGGNGLKIPKFHLPLHITRNICRHGPLENYDGARQEANAKYLAKCPALRTQKHHKSISIQTANRYHEDLTIVDAERMYHEHLTEKEDKEYDYFSPTCNKRQRLYVNDNGIINSPPTMGGSKFIIRRSNNNQNIGGENVQDEQDEFIRTWVQWDDERKNNEADCIRFNNNLLQCVSYMGPTRRGLSCP